LSIAGCTPTRLGVEQWVGSKLILRHEKKLLTRNSYVFQWLITLPLELVASSITLQYWGNPLKNHASWVTIFLVLIVAINILGVKRFADFEAGFSVMKVLAIVGFM